MDFRLTAIPLLGLLGAVLLSPRRETPDCCTWRAEDRIPLEQLKVGAKEVRLETLDIRQMSIGWGSPQKAQSVDRHPLSIGTRTFEHGVGTHANSSFELNLNRQATRFSASVGVDAEVGARGTVAFKVFVDNKLVFDSGVMKGGQEAKAVDVDLKNAKLLRLEVTDGEDDINYDHADWAEAKLTISGDASKITVAKPVPYPPPTIAHFNPHEVRINGPRVLGGSPGKPIVFRIPATGKAPLKFTATGMPPGLNLDPSKGVLSGTAKQGTYNLKIDLKAANGHAKRDLKLIIGENKLAQTPPMGWNSWNVWGTAVDAKKVQAAAKMFLQTGFAGVGYRYVNIDDAWEGARGSDGKITVNQKFGNMKALADSLHSEGLLLGIYSSPGPKTCAQYEGSYQYERDDAQTYAEWGIDYLKYDWCSYGGIAKDNSLPELQKPYALMHEELAAVNRDILFSLCQYGMGDVPQWGAKVGGNCWRTTGDIGDSWGSMNRIGFAQGKWAPYAGPGHWNDPDMLVVGKVGWGPSLHDTQLNKHEQMTHITLWCMLAAPLLIGCDLTQLDDWTRDLLCNPEVIEVDQDSIGKAAQKVEEPEVWARPLNDGCMAVALFNRGREPSKVTTHFSNLGLTGEVKVRDLWRRKDLGKHEGSFSATVPPHGVVLVKLSK